MTVKLATSGKAREVQAKEQDAANPPINLGKKRNFKRVSL